MRRGAALDGTRPARPSSTARRGGWVHHKDVRGVPHASTSSAPREAARPPAKKCAVPRPSLRRAFLDRIRHRPPRPPSRPPQLARAGSQRPTPTRADTANRESNNLLPSQRRPEYSAGDRVQPLGHSPCWAGRTPPERSRGRRSQISSSNSSAPGEHGACRREAVVSPEAPSALRPQQARRSRRRPASRLGRAACRGKKTSRTWIWPVRRPSAPRRGLRSMPSCVRRSHADRAPHRGTTPGPVSRTAFPRLGGQQAVLHRDDCGRSSRARGSRTTSPPSASVPKRVLELVSGTRHRSNPPGSIGSRLEAVQPADPPQRIVHLARLRLELAVVGEDLPGRTRVVSAGARWRSGLGSSSSTACPSA